MSRPMMEQVQEKLQQVQEQYQSSTIISGTTEILYAETRSSWWNFGDREWPPEILSPNSQRRHISDLMRSLLETLESGVQWGKIYLKQWTWRIIGGWQGQREAVTDYKGRVSTVNVGHWLSYPLHGDNTNGVGKTRIQGSRQAKRYLLASLLDQNQQKS